MTISGHSQESYIEISLKSPGEINMKGLFLIMFHTIFLALEIITFLQSSSRYSC